MTKTETVTLLRKTRELAESLVAIKTTIEPAEMNRLGKLAEEIAEVIESPDAQDVGETLVGAPELCEFVEEWLRLESGVAEHPTVPGVTHAAEALSGFISPALFATKLRAAREQAGQSIRELERRSGVSNSYIGQLESGASPPPSVKVAVRLGRALGLTEDQLRDFYLEQFAPAVPESAQLDLLWDPAVRDILAVAEDLSPTQRALLADLARAVRKHLADDD